MSGASSSPGVRLCQWLHCHSCPGAPVSLSINYLFHSKHGLTLSKRLVHSLSIHRETRSSCSFLLSLCALWKNLWFGLCCQIAHESACLFTPVFVCLCLFVWVYVGWSELGLHHGSGVWPVREAGAVGGSAGQRQLHAGLGHTRQEVGGQTCQSDTRQVSALLKKRTNKSRLFIFLNNLNVDDITFTICSLNWIVPEF